jgi:hypothetical protein
MRSSGLASTIYTVSILDDMSLKDRMVWQMLGSWHVDVMEDCSAYSKHVIHESASARTDLNKLDAIFRSSLGHPFCYEPNANQLAKNLRDFGRGDEISPPPKLVTALLESSCVVATCVRCETHAHITSQRDRASYLESLSTNCVQCTLRCILTFMASVSCFANGVDHFRLSSLFAAVAAKPRQPSAKLDATGFVNDGFELANPWRAVREMADLIFIPVNESYLTISGLSTGAG